MDKAKLKELLDEFDGVAGFIGRCSDGYCYVGGKATGMHTNGGCRCWRDDMKAQRLMLAGRKLRDKLAEIVDG